MVRKCGDLRLTASVHSGSRGHVSPKSSLLLAAETGSAKITACFGGQGYHNGSALDHLTQLYRSYAALLEQLLSKADSIFTELASIPHHSSFHAQTGFSLRAWISEPSSAPDRDYLALSPMSFPLNTLLSLLQFCVTCHELELSPSELGGHFSGITGHSQGLIAAAVVAQTEDWTSFFHGFEQALRLSFFLGLETHHAASISVLDSASQYDCIEHGEGVPSWMLSVSGLGQIQLQDVVDKVNFIVGERQQVHIAIENSRTKFVIAGPPQILYLVCIRLRSVGAPDGLDQTRTNYHERKPVINVQFLPISAPYHSPYLEEAAKRVLNQIDTDTLSRPCKIQLHHPKDGSDFCGETTENVASLHNMVRAITSEPMDWPRVCLKLHDNGCTHWLDFGPGNTASLIHEISEGLGIRVISVQSPKVLSSLYVKSIGGQGELLSPAVPPLFAPNWQQLFKPKLITDADGTRRIETKMTQLFGVPPVMVAGMTPTTVSWEFVATIMRAGYHAELAGGGYYDEMSFERAIRQLAQSVPQERNRGLTCNLLYANPRTMAWQVSLLTRLVQDGVPLDGITIGAGVPSPSVVKDYINDMGLRHISFKPGSHNAIEEVIAVAESHPNFPIGLQWTGGRAGGHHSWEDIHEPMLKTYGRIRSCSNIVLIIGGGFGDGPSTLPYLTGEWAVQLGYPPMPFDGVMLGSRMMVAAEAHTSPQAKRLIVQASGVDDHDWHKCAHGPAGGVLTITSEMGQPIHVLATRGMLLWKEFDEQIFSIKDMVKRAEYLLTHRSKIALRLNKDYCRPWFPVHPDGSPARDIEEMSYLGVLTRLCDLMYVKHQGRWISSSYQNLVQNFIDMSYKRFGHEAHSRMLETPIELIEEFSQEIRDGAEKLLYPDDVDRLFALFRRRGQKPVPFIPRLDDDFETWFKKDTLWQSEDVESLIDQDAQRACIIHGPIAARYSTSCDNSAKDILDSVHQHHIRAYMQQHMALADGPTAQAMRNSSTTLSMPSGLREARDDNSVQYSLIPNENGFSLDSALQYIAKVAGVWAETCLLAPHIFQGSLRVTNPIRFAFESKTAGTFKLEKLHDGAYSQLSFSPAQSEHRLLLQLKSPDQVRMKFTLPGAHLSAQKMGCSFVFELRTIRGVIQLHQDDTDRYDTSRDLYWRLWLPDVPNLHATVGIGSNFSGGTTIITQRGVDEYLNVLRRNSPNQTHLWNPQGALIPIDYGVVLAWRALTQPLMIACLNCDLTQLLHRSISVQYITGAQPLLVNDAIQTDSRITALTSKSTGRIISITADIKRRGQSVMTIQSDFFVPGRTNEQLRSLWKSVLEPEYTLQVANHVLEALLLSREWLIFEGSSLDLMGKSLLFLLRTQHVLDRDGNPTLIQVSGVVLDQNCRSAAVAQIGRVYLELEYCNQNPVIDFLHQHGSPRFPRRFLQNPRTFPEISSVQIQAPLNSEAYAAVSGDLNPIHVSRAFSRFAGHDECVVHGMHTSALVRRVVEWLVGDTDRSRFRGWQVSFEAPVFHGETLQLEMEHIAMEEGRMIHVVRASRSGGGGKVLEAEADIEQPHTSYIFCGQGSQEKGMGMSLYARDTVSADIWDKGESCLKDRYGFSLLKIVKDNPQSLTVHFGGKHGRQIRNNYLSMTRQVRLPTGEIRHEPLIPGLTQASTSYTFSYPAGLLYSTNFSQPALVLMELAEHARLRAQGVVPSNARFAGHSLGEYASLGAFTSFMPFEDLLSLVFYRGLKMHGALPRDQNGVTGYSMMAVDPSRIGKGLSQPELLGLVELVAEQTGQLLEVVNYNVPSQQYVCAGHCQSLWIFGELCDKIASEADMDSTDSDDIRQFIGTRKLAAQRLPDPVRLARGKATIPLPGIDIPFHSTMLRSEIEDFRSQLARCIRKDDIDPQQLVGRWVPNVVGRSFSLDRAYVEDVQRITQSQSLKRLLAVM